MTHDDQDGLGNCAENQVFWAPVEDENGPDGVDLDADGVVEDENRPVGEPPGLVDLEIGKNRAESTQNRRKSKLAS